MEENLNLASQFIERLQLFVVSFILSLWVGWIAWRRGFFHLPQDSFSPHVRGITVFEAFLFFIITNIVILPILVGTMWALKEGLDVTQMGKALKLAPDWTSLFWILGSFLIVVRVFYNVKADQRQLILGQKPWYQQATFGGASWFIAYPFMLTVTQFVAMIVILIFQELPIEQVAVRQLKDLRAEWWQFSLLSIAIVTLVPFTEEILFRGLLQSWLKYKTQRSWLAILLTSLVFALFHFSSEQGLTNIELFFAIFLLSCFLGFLYERQRSLWASIGLHAVFNGMSILLLI
jgi:membrane protease YdiL (CAAX protease family)